MLDAMALKKVAEKLEKAHFAEVKRVFKQFLMRL